MKSNTAVVVVVALLLGFVVWLTIRHLKDMEQIAECNARIRQLESEKARREAWSGRLSWFLSAAGLFVRTLCLGR